MFTQKLLRLLLFLFLLIYTCLNCRAQKIATFQHSYGNAFDSYAYSGLALPDKGFIISAQSEIKINSQSYAYIILFVRTDSLGRQIWTKSYQGFNGGSGGGKFLNGKAADLALTPDGDIAVGTNNDPQGYGSNGPGYLFKIDLNGNVIWSKTYLWNSSIYSNPITYISNLNNDATGGFIINGVIQGIPNYLPFIPFFPTPLILKTNSIGAITWAKTYSDNQYIDSNSLTINYIAPLRAGGYVIGGSTNVLNSSLQSSSDYFLMKIDKNGKQIWNHVFETINEEEVNSILELPDKSIYLLGTYNLIHNGVTSLYVTGSIQKLDSIGNLKWSKQYNFGTTGNQVAYFGTPIYDSTANIIDVFIQDINEKNGLMMMDTNGSVITVKLYPSASDIDTYCPEHNLSKLQSGGFAIVGGSKGLASPGYDIFLIKADKNGNTNTCNTDSLKPTVSNYPLNTYSINVYATIPSISIDTGCKVFSVSMQDSVICPPFVSNFGLVNTCFGQTTQFYDSSYYKPVTWKWDFGDATYSTKQNPTHQYAHSGTYNVKLVADNGTVKDSVTKTITIYPLPVPFKFDTLICGGNTITLRASGGATYKWSPAKLVSNSTSATPNTTPKRTTNYIVEAISTHGCITYDTVHVTVDNIPSAPLIDYATVKNNTEIDVKFQRSDSNDVAFYDVYRSVNGSTFSKIQSIANTANTDSFYLVKDIGVNAITNTYSYEFQVRDSCGAVGSFSAVHTPVLLTGKAGELQSQLSWGFYGGFASSQYTLQSWTSLKGWVDIDSGSNIQPNADSFNVPGLCNTAQYFRMRVAETGVGNYISYSDTVAVTPFDTVRPLPPVMEYVTLQNNNHAYIKWEKSVSMNIGGYNIYRNDPVKGWKQIASIGNDSFYIDSAINGTESYCYAVQTLDSCNQKTSALSTTHCTIYLSVSQIGCTQGLKLNWDAYSGWASVKNYNIFRSVNGGNDSLIATVSGTLTTYNDTDLNHLNKYCYTITALDGADSFQSQSNTVCKQTFFPETPQVLAASKISTSTTNGSIFISWGSINKKGLAYNLLYFSKDGKNFIPIGGHFLPGMDSFVQSGLDTRDSDYFYYLVTVDSCGAQSVKSPTSKTMTLTVSVGELLHKLNWTAYQGFKIKDYQIERLQSGVFVTIDSVPGNDTFSREFPAPCNYAIRYRIAAIGYDSGEVAWSDTMGRQAIDTIPSDPPVLLNATVLNGSSARINFIGSDSADTYEFAVQRSIDGSWGTAKTFLYTHPSDSIQFIDTGLNTIQNHYCYTIITLDSCLNASESDTFCLINLQGKGVQLSDSLSWYPFQGYSLKDYAVLTRNTSGVWDTLTKVNPTDTVYFNNPLNCRQTITYKIAGAENSGNRISFSDSITITPFDTISPPPPIIKYATVLNSSQIALYWQKSVPIVHLYEISIKTTNGNWKVSDTVKDDTSFVFNGLNTTDSAYSFRVVAIDSCALNRSLPSVFHSPMLLSGKGQNLSNLLTWKPYEGWTSVSEYYIYQWVNSAWKLIDSVGGNTSSYLQDSLPCNTVQSYKLSAIDNTRRFLSFSDSISLTPFDTIKPDAPKLYYATVQQDQTVKLSWQWNPKSKVKYFEIWRGSNHNVPVLIDNVISDSVYIDKNAKVRDSVYSYFVIAIDSCNATNRSRPSQKDSLMLIKLYSMYCSPQVQVHWTPFVGLPNGVNNYDILRSTDGVNFTSDGSVNAATTMFIDNSVTIGKQYYYKVEAIDIKSGYISYSDTLGIVPRLIPLADSAQLVYATVLKSDETNGEIYVQWKRALRNDTNARGYYVYSYNLTNGKYALLKDVTDLNDTSYIQYNINTLQNAYKYYIVTYNVCDVGINSNIHKTILLQAQSENLSSSLVWNNYFGIPVKTYSVYRSEDGGAQNLVFNAGLDSTFSDSNVNCNHHYTYQVQGILANGEISFSDSITVKSYDTIRPKTKPIISATVTKTGITDGEILLSWNAATDNNLAGYDIYRSQDGIGWILIRQQYPGTSVIDTGLDTYDHSYYYKIQPVDSCGNFGNVALYHETIRLKAKTDNGYNQLFWNGYVGWNVKEYLVYKDGILIDTVGNNVFGFKDTTIICKTVYQYLIKAVDSINDTIISTSNTDSAKASSNIPPQKVYIKTVKVSNPNKAATISWTPSKSYDLKNYFIYRKSAIDGSMKFIDSSTNITYTDSSFAQKEITEPDCYYVFARDHCDNQSDGSNQGCIIILSAKNQPGYNDLSWNSYLNWPDGVQSYNVYKNEDSTGWQLIGTTSSVQVNEFKDSKLGDSTIDFCYQVEAIENPGQYNQLSRSTVECVHQDATVFIPNSFTPYDQDGLNDNFGPLGAYIKNYSMRIYNRWGELVYNTSSGKAWDGTFQGKFVQQGVYIYLITVTDYNSQQSYFKGTITMFE